MVRPKRSYSIILFQGCGYNISTSSSYSWKCLHTAYFESSKSSFANLDLLYKFQPLKFSFIFNQYLVSVLSLFGFQVFRLSSGL